MTSTLDSLIARTIRRVSLFHQGWGDRALLEQFQETGLPFREIRPLRMKWIREQRLRSVTIHSGIFESPFTFGTRPVEHECRRGHVELILPRGADEKTPICVHFAASGDEGFVRRRWTMALPLVKRGIGSLLLENPFYGKRRPAGQRKWILRRVEDLWAMALGTVEEGRSLVHWLRGNGFQHLGVTGISMGGFMAAVVGTLEQKPVTIVPCLAPHSGASVFTEGVMSFACDWKTLEADLGGRKWARDHLRELLEVTDIRTLPPPSNPELAILVAAKRDGFVPPRSTRILHQHWSGSEIRWLDTGHAGAFLFHRSAFLEAISDGFKKLRSS